MRRKTISEAEYMTILDELVVTGMHATVLSVIIGTHEALGRVVLLRSGKAFVLIADRLEAPTTTISAEHGASADRDVGQSRPSVIGNLVSADRS